MIILLEKFRTSVIITLIDVLNIQFASKEQTLFYQSFSFHKILINKNKF